MELNIEATAKELCKMYGWYTAKAMDFIADSIATLESITKDGGKLHNYIIARSKLGAIVRNGYQRQPLATAEQQEEMEVADKTEPMSMVELITEVCMYAPTQRLKNLCGAYVQSVCSADKLAYGKANERSVMNRLHKVNFKPTTEECRKVLNIITTYFLENK